MDSPLPPELLAAYLGTRYHVRHGAGFDFHVGRPSDELRALMAAHGADSCTFITAWNPRSDATPREENDARNRKLEDDLREIGVRWFGAEGIGPTGWREESYLVPGLGLERSVELAKRYRQNAIVFAGKDGVPRLEVTA